MMAHTRFLSTFFGCLVALLVGCAGEEDSNSAGNTGAAFLASEFTGGVFQLSVLSVDDSCLDGSLQLLFMPDGNLQPYQLANPTEFPAASELPSPFVVRLEAPFSTLPMELTGVDGNRLFVAEAQQNDVMLGVAGTGECTADMTFFVSLTVSSDDELALATSVILEGFDHPDCPAVQSTPCEVVLDMRGARQ